MMPPKYPNAVVRVDLAGPDSNSFLIMAKAIAAMKAVGASQPEIDDYHKEATAGDYANLLEVTRRWCDFASEGRN